VVWVIRDGATHPCLPKLVQTHSGIDSSWCTDTRFL